MKRQTRADLAMTTAVLLLGVSLIFSGFSLVHRTWGSDGFSRPADLAELLGVMGAGIGIAVVCWWLLALIFACLGVFARSLGAHHVASLSESCTPAFMRRLVVAVLGINLLAAPLAQAAEAPGIDPQWHPETVATAPPTSASVPSLAAPPAVAGKPTPDATQAVAPQWVPHTADTDPGPLVSPATRPTTAQQGAASGANENKTDDTTSNIPPGNVDDSDVVVKRGDSLWSIVAQALGPYSTDVEVALAWPGWYSTNRATIGPDPNFIQPGQVLHRPLG